MSFLHLAGISIGLGMDAFAVSMANGIKLKEMHVIHSFNMALLFGIFQAVMPLLGWYLGVHIVDFVKSIDHWVAFLLLSGIGIKMIHESIQTENNKKDINPGNLTTLLLLSVATSIDAFAVGFTFALLDILILTPVLIIGFVTFLMSLTGIYLGKRFGLIFRKKAETVGGIILILIGIKIVIEHIFIG